MKLSDKYINNKIRRKQNEKLKSMLLSFVVLTVLLTACGNNSGKQEESKAKVQTDQNR